MLLRRRLPEDKKLETVNSMQHDGLVIAAQFNMYLENSPLLYSVLFSSQGLKIGALGVHLTFAARFFLKSPTRAVLMLEKSRGKADLVATFPLGQFSWRIPVPQSRSNLVAIAGIIIDLILILCICSSILLCECFQYYIAE